MRAHVGEAFSEWISHSMHFAVNTIPLSESWHHVITVDKKAQWEQHLPELLQAYNSARSAVTGYSPHYLMLGRCPHLPVDFYFPTMSTHVCSCHILAYVGEVRKHFKEAYAEAHLQTNSKADWQKQYYDRTTSTMQLMPGDIVFMKLDVFQGKRKVKDRWSKAEYVVVCQVADDVPMYKVQDNGGNVKVVHCNQLFLVASGLWRLFRRYSKLSAAICKKKNRD